MRRIEVTPALRAALKACHDAEAIYTPGAESASVVELPKLALADAVLTAVAAQTRRVDRLPARAHMVGVVDVTLRPKRKRSA